MFSIGEFSKITGLPIKTLRFYHERGLLVPSSIDERTGYRYYDQRQIDKARIITGLKSLAFSLEHISEMLADYNDEADILPHLEAQKRLMEERVSESRAVAASIEQLIQKEQEARLIMRSSVYEVQEKAVAPQLIAGVRMQGRYCDCGQGFAKIGKTFGRHICGNCFLLHYDTEYKEADADFEACMPIRQALDAQGISVRQLDGGPCVSLLHQGPYDTLGRSYAKILTYVKEKGYELVLPTREIYVKGPGMIFKGNPKNYLTEIQMLIVRGVPRATPA
jgi:DNA-binding transcriptional MerR regulator